jgi:hypothetical protein
MSDHRHRCGGLADAGKRESFTKWLSWMAEQAPNRAPAAPPRGRSGTQGTGSGHVPANMALSM